MSDKDYIKDLFSEKLGNYEAKVNPELWNSIASQIGTAGATATVATGLSLAAKWIIGVGIAGALTVTAVLVTNNSEEPAENPTQTEETVSEQSSNAQEENNSSATTDATTDATTQQDPAATDDRTTQMDHQQTAGAPGDVNPYLPVNTYTPILIPTSQNDQILEQIIHRQTIVHTVDPVVKEPFLPAEMPAELPESSQEPEKAYSVDKLPNVFTPNGDGANDYFEIKSENLTDFHVVVTDAQNKVVFESHDPNFRWNGQDMSGQIVRAGNYVYYISAAEFANDKPKRYSPLLINY